MFDFALVLLVDTFHNQLDQHRTFTAEAFKIDFLSVIGAVHRFAVVEKVRHLDTEQQRLFGKFHIEAVI